MKSNLKSKQSSGTNFTHYTAVVKADAWVFSKLKSHHEGVSAWERKPQLIRQKSFVIYAHWARLVPLLQSELGKAGKSLQRTKGDFPACPITFPFVPGLPVIFQKEGAGHW